MNISKLFRLLAVCLVCLVAGLIAYSVILVPDAVSLVAENRMAILAVFSIVIGGAVWGAYNRLGHLDKLDGVNDRQRQLIGTHAASLRARLVRVFTSSGVVAMMLVLVTMSAPYLPAAKYLLAVTCAFLFVFFVRSLWALRNMLLDIETLLADVNSWRTKETLRKQQIELLKKGRAEFPVSHDPHLQKYRNLLITE